MTGRVRVAVWDAAGPVMDIPDGSDPAAPVYALDGLGVAWGRDSAWDQPAASTLAVEVHLGLPPWPAWVQTYLMVVGTRLVVSGSSTPAGPEVVVFSGKVTDTQLGWPEGALGPRLVLTAVDDRAAAESDVVGAAPFPSESATARLTRLEAVAGTGMWADLPGAAPAPTVLAGQDVDAQPWAGLVEAVAVALDAAAWPVWAPDPADPTGPARAGMLVEPMATRPVTTTLHLSGGMVVVGPIRSPGPEFADVSACLADRDGVVWGRSSGTLLTRVSVSWIDITDPDLTEHTVTVTDPVREGGQGVHGASVSTLLTTAAAATAMAQAVLARSTPEAWAVSALLLDSAELPADDPAAVEVFDALLGVASRPGHPVRVMDLPAWNPAGDTLAGFVEGGRATFTDGRWTHEVTIASLGGTGSPAAWSDLPAGWSWSMFAPDVQWFDLGVPVET